MIKRYSLKSKKPPVVKKKRFSLKDVQLYYSGFCLTDNLNFALFDISDQFIVDNALNSVLPFKLTEDDLQMLIDRSKPVNTSRGIISVTIHEYGLVDRNIFNLFNNEFLFYPVTEWFGNPCNRLITCVKEKESKPVGVLKTIKEKGE